MVLPIPIRYFHIIYTFAKSKVTQKKIDLQGLVGFGLIPSNFRDSIGDTMGGIGSAITLKRGTWKRSHDGTYTGTLLVQPDRGFNVYDVPSDYIALVPHFSQTQDFHHRLSSASP